MAAVCRGGFGRGNYSDCLLCCSLALIPVSGNRAIGTTLRRNRTDSTQRFIVQLSPVIVETITGAQKADGADDAAS